MLLAGVAVLLLVALGFALRRGRGGRSEEDRQAELLALYRARRAELERERVEGATGVELQADLDAALLDDWRDVGSAPIRTGGRGAVVIAVVGVLVLCVSVYWRIGDPTASELNGARDILSGELSEEALAAWQARLARRNAAKPDDAQSWYLSGLVALQQQAYVAASEAFAEAHAVQGDDPSIDAYWLQARYLAAGGRLDGQSVTIAKRLLEADPDNLMVLELLAVERYRAADYAQSLLLLNRALSSARSVDRQVALTQMVAQVRSRLGAAEGPGIEVSVSSAPGAPGDGSVFVIARPVGGGVPYAVARRPALMLPFAVRLDDSVSMSTDRPLSSASEVEVVVRLSVSGQPMAGEGDWQWTSALLDLSAERTIALTAHLQPPVRADG